MAEEMYALAMYDVRGKQSFIFRTNRIKEIVGGSKIIEDCFNKYLYSAAEKIENSSGIYSYTRIEGDTDFSKEKFEEHLSQGYVGEVIYDGGGNFFVLYKNKEVCLKINRIFTRKILEDIGTLKVICSYIEVNTELDDYKRDRDNLYAEHAILENQESVTRPVNTLPIVQVDRKTTMPLCGRRMNEANEKEKLSREQTAKYKKYNDIVKTNKAEMEHLYGKKFLDDLVLGKGESSLLAVAFIDGNSMGAKVQNALNGENKSYENSIKRLRNLSNTIKRDYVDGPKKAVMEALGEESRFVVFAGDEMNFVCQAQKAWKAVNAYFNALPKECSSCAGIAIFHSHAPYADAYRIAEECCETGKKWMKDHNETNTRYIDFQYLQSGLGMDLKSIREREVNSDFISKPWLIGSEKDYEETIQPGIHTIEEVDRVIGYLREAGGRTNIKGLAYAAKKSLADFDREMARIYAHNKLKMSEPCQEFFKKKQSEEKRKLIYDIVLVYDIWFNKEETKDAA